MKDLSHTKETLKEGLASKKHYMKEKRMTAREVDTTEKFWKLYSPIDDKR